MDDMDDSADFIEPASASDDNDNDNDSASVFTTDRLAFTSDYDPTLNHTTTASLVGSVTDSVNEHVYENGRRYHRYKSGRYPIPNDDMEASRENVRNALFSELLGGQLHLAPIGDSPQHIMDVGTGFGDWAIDAGDWYPSARVVGLDLSPIQSVWIPPNVEFVVDDVEDNTWIHGSDFDLIHFRMVAVVLQDPAAAARTAYENLRPGGWVEFQEVYPRIGCHDDTLGVDPENYVVTRFYRLAARVLRGQYGWDLFAAEHLPRQLEELGFVNVKRRVCHVPIGYWPKDPRRMQHAFLFEETLTEFMAAMQAKPLSGGIDVVFDDVDGKSGERIVMSADEVDALCDEVRAALRVKHVHAYIPFHFIWAQKPERAPA